MSDTNNSNPKSPEKQRQLKDLKPNEIKALLKLKQLIGRAKARVN